jgi:hypothetical protein
VSAGFVYLFFILSFSSLLYLGLNHGRWIFHFWTDGELLAMVAAVVVDISTRGCHAVFFFAFLFLSWFLRCGVIGWYADLLTGLYRISGWWDACTRSFSPLP